MEMSSRTNRGAELRRPTSNTTKKIIFAHLYKNPETYRHRGLLEAEFWLLGGRNSNNTAKLMFEKKCFFFLKNTKMVNV